MMMAVINREIIAFPFFLDLRMTGPSFLSSIELPHDLSGMQVFIPGAGFPKSRIFLHQVSHLSCG